ncbi:unnamed protein product [Soboliphyme baturini]|uniref:Uncharacterized protein n=1 Tax=Soboliphyme baturini TaxID=241478 RepID=A0A183IP14_9BILA|nr:unnamed protein product [Soboliphyme baturini]
MGVALNTAGSLLYGMLVCVSSLSVQHTNEVVKDRVSRNTMRNLYGIPVPGNVIEALDVLKAYLHLCTNDFKEREQNKFISKLLSSPNAKQLVDQLYQNLFSSVGEVNASRLTGKWYHVMDTKPPEREKCGVSYDFVIKTGPLSGNGQYEYVMFAQFLKHPIITWARDPVTFHLNYTKDIEGFLEKSELKNFLARAGEGVHYYNHLLCPVSFYQFINL